MDEGPRIGRSLLEAFANALLERALPRIRQWLAQRLGPHAELRTLELDGARVHLIGARLPLGDRVVLHATRATFATHPEELALGRAPIQLERLEGHLEITQDGRSLRGDVSFEGAEAASGDAWIDGRLVLREITIGGARFAGSAELTVTSERFAIEGATLTSAEARLELGAGGAFGAGSYRVEHAQLEAHAIPFGLLMELARLVHGGDAPALPIQHARASMSAALERDGAMHALATLEGHGARAELRGRGKLERDGALSGEAHGSLEPALLTIGSARMRGEPITLRATLSGTRAEPIARFEAASPRVEPLSGLALTRVRASCHIGGGGATFEARARTERGSITLARSANAQLSAKLERVPLAPLRSFVKASWLSALAIEEGELFAELSGTSDSLVGSAHLATPRASVTLAPIRAALGARRIELSGTTRATLRGEALAHLLDDRALGLPSRSREAPGEDRTQRSVEPSPNPSREREGDRTSDHLGESRVALGGAIELEMEVARACLAGGALDELRARGVARARSLTVTVERRAELILRDASASLELERDMLHVEEARAHVLGGVVRARGFVRARQLVVTELALEAVRGLGRWITELPLAQDDIVDARLRREDGALRGPITARTARSAIEARVVIAEDGGLAGSRLQGSLALSDLEPLLRDWSIRPDESGRWTLGGTIEGSLLEPAFVLDAESEAQPLWLVTRTESVRLDAQGARARVRIESSRVAWSELALSLYGGTLRSFGSSALGIVSAHVELEGIEAGSLPLARGTLGAHLGGRLGATLDVMHARGAGAITQGRVTVEAPVYRALEQAAGLLRGLELPMPDLRGTAPLAADVQLGRAGWTVSALDARLAELAVSGSVGVDREGSLRGRLVVRPAAAWLRASAYLAPLRELVTAVPVRVSGSIGAPRLDASALSTLDAALERSPIGQALQAIARELGAPDPEPAPRDPMRLLSTDALLDRLAREPDGPEPLGELLARGLDVEAIAHRVRRR